MSLSLSRQSGRVRDLLVCLSVGLIFGFLTQHYFTMDDGTYSQSYKDMLSNVWLVFAGWVPMMVLILSLLISNSERALIKVLSATGALPFFINNIVICGGLILTAAVFLFVHEVIDNPGASYTFICTTITATTISYFVLIFYLIALIGKNLHKADNAKTATTASATKQTDSAL